MPSAGVTAVGAGTGHGVAEVRTELLPPPVHPPGGSPIRVVNTRTWQPAAHVSGASGGVVGNGGHASVGLSIARSAGEEIPQTVV